MRDIGQCSAQLMHIQRICHAMVRTRIYYRRWYRLPPRTQMNWIMAGISVASRSGLRSEMDCQIDSADRGRVDSDFTAYAMLVISIMPLITRGQTERSREGAAPERAGDPAPVRASRAESSARRKHLTGTVSVGLSQRSMAEQLAIPLLKAVRNAPPGVTLNLNLNSGVRQSELVMNGRIDMALLGTSLNGTYIPMASDSYPSSKKTCTSRVEVCQRHDVRRGFTSEHEGAKLLSTIGPLSLRTAGAVSIYFPFETISLNSFNAAPATRSNLFVRPAPQSATDRIHLRPSR